MIVKFYLKGIEAYMTTIDSYTQIAEFIGVEVVDSIKELKKIYGMGTHNWSLFDSTLIQETLEVS